MTAPKDFFRNYQEIVVSLNLLLSCTGSVTANTVLYKSYCVASVCANVCVWYLLAYFGSFIILILYLSGELAAGYGENLCQRLGHKGVHHAHR
jgi:hypothetical protein